MPKFIEVCDPCQYLCQIVLGGSLYCIYPDTKVGHQKKFTNEDYYMYIGEAVAIRPAICPTRPFVEPKKVEQMTQKVKLILVKKDDVDITFIDATDVSDIDFTEQVKELANLMAYHLPAGVFTEFVQQHKNMQISAYQADKLENTMLWQGIISQANQRNVNDG